MAQSADLLSALHQSGITGCAISLDNLVVQPGDRIALLEPSGCTYDNTAGTEANGNGGVNKQALPATPGKSRTFAASPPSWSAGISK